MSCRALVNLSMKASTISLVMQSGGSNRRTFVPAHPVKQCSSKISFLLTSLCGMSSTTPTISPRPLTSVIWLFCFCSSLSRDMSYSPVSCAFSTRCSLSKTSSTASAAVQAR